MRIAIMTLERKISVMLEAIGKEKGKNAFD